MLPVKISIMMFLSLKIVFILTNREDPDELPFSSGSSLFAKVPVYRCP